MGNPKQKHPDSKPATNAHGGTPEVSFPELQTRDAVDVSKTISVRYNNPTEAALDLKLEYTGYSKTYPVPAGESDTHQFGDLVAVASATMTASLGGESDTRYEVEVCEFKAVSLQFRINGTGPGPLAAAGPIAAGPHYGRFGVKPAQIPGSSARVLIFSEGRDPQPILEYDCPAILIWHRISARKWSPQWFTYLTDAPVAPHGRTLFLRAVLLDASGKILQRVQEQH